MSIFRPSALLKACVPLALSSLLISCTTLDNAQTAIASRITGINQSNAKSSADTPSLETQVEKGLAELGYSPGTVDGIVDVRTELAVQEFQLDRGLRITGRIDEALRDAVNAALDERQ